jgi:hypothetical protein
MISQSVVATFSISWSLNTPMVSKQGRDTDAQNYNIGCLCAPFAFYCWMQIGKAWQLLANRQHVTKNV